MFACCQEEGRIFFSVPWRNRECVGAGLVALFFPRGLILVSRNVTNIPSSSEELRLEALDSQRMLQFLPVTVSMAAASHILVEKRCGLWTNPGILVTNNYLANKCMLHVARLMFVQASVYSTENQFLAVEGT